jgi:hypothetical protein
MAYEVTIRVVQRFGRGLSGKRRVREMRRVGLLLTSAVAQRDEGLLEAALKAHFLQKRLGWEGLWFLLPR